MTTTNIRYVLASFPVCCSKFLVCGIAACWSSTSHSGREEMNMCRGQVKNVGEKVFPRRLNLFFEVHVTKNAYDLVLPQ